MSLKAIIDPNTIIRDIWLIPECIISITGTITHTVYETASITYNMSKIIDAEISSSIVILDSKLKSFKTKNQTLWHRYWSETS